MSDPVITPCPHDFALAEWCPMCLRAEIERLRADNEALRQELASLKDELAAARPASSWERTDYFS